MRQVFADPVLDERYRRDGYRVVPLLSPAEAEALLHLYDGLPAPADRGFHVTIHGADTGLRRTVDREVRAVLAPRVQAVLAGFRACTANFVVKEAGPDDSTVPVHQDWSMVNETVHCSVNVWCPLVDVTPENGALHVFPGSHRFVHTLRGPLLPNPFTPLGEVVRREYLREVLVRAGEAVLFDHRLAHYSPPNRSSARRVVANLTAVPEGVPVLHYHRDPAGPDDRVEVFEVDDEFFIRHRMGTRPDAGARSLGTVEYRCPTLAEDDLRHLAAAAARGEFPRHAEAPMS